MFLRTSSLRRRRGSRGFEDFAGQSLGTVARFFLCFSGGLKRFFLESRWYVARVWGR